MTLYSLGFSEMIQVYPFTKLSGLLTSTFFLVSYAI
jgi:hypothetical protein